MTVRDVAVLLVTGVLAGLVSSIVSLASLISYPVLLAVGLPPVAANVTNTVALVFSGIGSVLGSRPELVGQRTTVLRLGLVTASGGALGAAILLVAPEGAFAAVAPWLVGGASLLLLVQPRLQRAAAQYDGPTRDRRGRGRRAAWLLALLAASSYTGYFGAAGGLLLIVVLGALVDEALVRVNALKNAVAGIANGVAASGFAVFGPVRWAAVVPLAFGFLLGGWVGPSIARRLPARALRIVLVLAGLGVAAKLGVDAYAA